MLIDHLRQVIRQRDTDLERLGHQLVERDVAYSDLQGVTSSYFERVQEAARAVSPGGADRALRFANQTIEHQRRVFQQQKNILRPPGPDLSDRPEYGLGCRCECGRPRTLAESISAQCSSVSSPRSSLAGVRSDPDWREQEYYSPSRRCCCSDPHPPSDPSPSQASTSWSGAPASQLEVPTSWVKARRTSDVPYDRAPPSS
ncbi:hypothetical protein ON010_g6693 [Phytophthora cinnamomi]|nr:hypothetical protein ON010_g6693 [Phytophthora cinnamomi]